MLKNKKLICVIALITTLLMVFSAVAFAQTGEDTNEANQVQISEWVNKAWSKIQKDKSFQPDKILTRVDCVTLINSLLDLKDKGEVSFTDVANDASYINEIAKALKAGYIKGRGDGIFDAEFDITKAEAYVMIARALNIGEGKEAKAILQFKDYTEGPVWAVGSIEALAEKGYINDKNKIKPSENILAAEAVDLLERIHSNNSSAEKQEEKKGGGNNPLNFVAAYIAEINENQSNNVQNVEEAVDFSENVFIKLEFDRGIVREYWENNKKQVWLKDAEGKEIAIEVLRIEGADSEKSFIFIKPFIQLESGQSYNIVMGEGLKANNGNTLGKEVIVTFSVK